jgi:hypothetical protein
LLCSKLSPKVEDIAVYGVAIQATPDYITANIAKHAVIRVDYKTAFAKA